MNLQLRAAAPEDHAFLHDLNRLAYEELVTRQFGGWDDSVQRQRFETKLRSAAFRIIELDGRPVGAVWSSDQEDHVCLNELLVLPEYQNRGIGSEVLRGELACTDTARKPMRLHTLLLNRAQEFYKRHGFIETGRGDTYIEMERMG